MKDRVFWKHKILLTWIDANLNFKEGTCERELLDSILQGYSKIRRYFSQISQNNLNVCIIQNMIGLEIFLNINNSVETLTKLLHIGKYLYIYINSSNF